MDLAVAAVVVVCIAMSVTVLYRRLGSAGASLPVTAEWIDELSVGRYEPMLRLLGNDDLLFVRRHPGITPAMVANFRRERCRVFRTYLGCLHADFSRVAMALKVVMVQSRYDRPELASVLLRSQRAFAFGMALVYCRLALYRYGLASVDATGLLKVFDGARLELRSLVPAQLGAAA